MCQKVGEFGTGQLPIAHFIADGVLLLGDLLHNCRQSGIIRDPGVDGFIEKQLAPCLQERVGKPRAVEFSEESIIGDNGTNFFLNRP